VGVGGSTRMAACRAATTRSFVSSLRTLRTDLRFILADPARVPSAGCDIRVQSWRGSNNRAGCYATSEQACMALQHGIPHPTLARTAVRSEPEATCSFNQNAEDLEPGRKRHQNAKDLDGPGRKSQLRHLAFCNRRQGCRTSLEPV